MRPSSDQHVLARLRKELGMNQTDFSEVADCSASTIQAIELKRLKLSTSLAEKIFLATGVSPNWLLANDRKAPMIDGVDGEPYTKAVYESLQAQKQMPSYGNKRSNRAYLEFALYRLIRAYYAAQKLSAPAAKIAVYRMNAFASELVKEFGQAQIPKKQVFSALSNVLDHADPATSAMTAHLEEAERRWGRTGGGTAAKGGG